MSQTFPNDAEGQALRRMAEGGIDMTKPMAVDFTVAVPDQRSGRLVAEAAETEGFRGNVSRDEASPGWRCTCTRTMVPEYDDIVSAQVLLDEISRPYGGRCDGWGTLGKAELE
jgi:hypothetical protein